MLNLATETDIERLRQAALLLEQENARLFRRLETLVAELAEARGEDVPSLQLEIAHLKEQLASRTKALFGDSSERRSCTDSRTGEKREARPGHGPRQQKTLPIVEIVHELDEPDQICPSCGGELRPMQGQFEEADEIDVVERSFRIVRHKRRSTAAAAGRGSRRPSAPTSSSGAGATRSTSPWTWPSRSMRIISPWSAKSGRWRETGSTWTPPRSGSRPGS